MSRLSDNVCKCHEISALFSFARYICICQPPNAHKTPENAPQRPSNSKSALYVAHSIACKEKSEK